MKKEEFEKGKMIFEIEGHRCYKIGDKFYEFVEPMESEFEKGERNAKFYWGNDITSESISGMQLFMSKKQYEESSVVVLREIVSQLSENGLSVKPSKEITIMTEKGAFGKFVCKEHEWVSAICDESFVIVHDSIDGTVKVKDMYYGDTLIKEIEPNSIHFYDEEKIFIASSAYENTKITLEEALAEFNKRSEFNHKLKDFGITASQAKSIVWEYNKVKNDLDKENENF